MNNSEIFKNYNLDLEKTYVTNCDKTIFNENSYSDVYGELTSDGLKKLFDSIDTENKIFYDFGSGTGNTIFRASINYNLKKCIGIELAHSRYMHSQKLLETINCTLIKNKIDFRFGDFLMEDISDADIIYISNCCFNEETNKKIGKKIINTPLYKECVIFCSRELFLNIPYETLYISQSWSDNTTILKYNYKPKKDME